MNSSLRPAALVQSHLPFALYPYQERTVNLLAPKPRSGVYLDIGTGKTIVAIAMAIYKRLVGETDATVIIVPPVLIPNWCRTLESIEGASYVAYVGPPAKRKQLRLDVDYVVVGYPLFKRDLPRLHEAFDGKQLFVIADEAQALKNVASQNYRRFREFTTGQSLTLLTGTPIGSPIDGYAMCKIVSPMIYKTLHQFESLHVAERDFFNKPKEWHYLDRLRANVECNAMRILKRDVLKDLKEPNYIPVHYELDPAHHRLYRKIGDEQLLEFSDGKKLDMTNASALMQNMNQVVCNAEFYSEGKVKSTIFELIDTVLDELGGRKLVIYTHYRKTSEAVFAHVAAHNPALLYGGLSAAKRQGAIDRFVKKRDCKVFVVAISAGGAGVDGLQKVCRDALFVELPSRATLFHQAVGRLDRDGQKFLPNIRIAIAEGTVQSRMWELVQENDSLTNMIVRGMKDIRKAIHGR